MTLRQADPPRRRDGRCAHCGGERTHAVWNKYSDDQAIEDPFCSAACCREFYEVPVTVTVKIGRPKVRQRKEATCQ